MSKMFTGAGRDFREVEALPMDREGLEDIKRRVKLQPHFLGEPLVVVAEAEDFPGVCPPDNEILVAIDASGGLAAVTLVMGVADSGEHVATLRLAAHLARISPDEIGRIARRFIDRPANEPLRRLWEEMDVEMSDDSVELASLLAAAFERDAEEFATLVNRTQRIIIAAEGFGSNLVGVVEWLSARGVAITGLRYRKFVVGGQDVFFAEQAVPRFDPTVDAPHTEPASREAAPRRTLDHAHHAEHLAPPLAAALDEILAHTREAAISVSWSNRYYFWIRGPRRNLRVRTYRRDRLEIGFHNAAPAAVAEFIEPYGLAGTEVISIGGYADSPFVAVLPDTRLDKRWRAMLCDWLSGANPGKTRVTE